MREIFQIESLLNEEKIKEAYALLRKKRKKIYPISLFYEGEILRMSGFFQKASSLYEKYLPFSSSSQEKKKIYVKIASCKRALGLKEEALIWCSKALKIDKKDEDIMLETAMVYRLCGYYLKAEKLFFKLIKSYSLKKDFSALSYAYWALGGLKRNYGALQDSKSYFLKSLKFSSRAKDNSLKVYSLFGLAGVCRIKGEIESSLKYYLKAGSIAEKNDIFALAYSFCGTANALRQLGRLDEAEKLYLKSKILYSRLGDKPDLGFVYWGLGEIYRKRGNLRTSLFYLKKSSFLFKQGFEKRGEILSLISSAKVLYALGQTDKARKNYFSALKKARSENINTYLEDYT
ncbi:MAG: tetratricopeptide repeat protein [Elusimicrobia bacterium]|nr:tetratricopeptide repeat protein [Elusimicrobiota bacterium]